MNLKKRKSKNKIDLPRCVVGRNQKLGTITHKSKKDYNRKEAKIKLKNGEFND